FDGFGPRPDIGTPIAPFAPERLRALQRFEGIDRARRSLKRCAVGEDEGDGLAILDRELSYRLEIFAIERNRTSQNQTLRAGDRADRPVIETSDPGNRRPIVEPGDVFGAKLHTTGSTHDNAYEVGPICRRHEIDNCGAARLGLKFGLEDERARTVAPFHGERSKSRSDEPSAILGRPEQRGEARRRIEPGPAQPVDRAVGAGQSHRFAIANEGVIFNSQRHGSSREAWTRSSLSESSCTTGLLKASRLWRGPASRSLARFQRPNPAMSRGSHSRRQPTAVSRWGVARAGARRVAVSGSTGGEKEPD